MIILYSIVYIIIGLFAVKLFYNTVILDLKGTFSIDSREDTTMCVLMWLLWPVLLILVTFWSIGWALKKPCGWIFK
jgi:hypothetical protein